jgi:hypothetical protein
MFTSPWLGTAANTEECITAEISPCYRPASWDEIGHFEIFNTSTKKYSSNPALASRCRRTPIESPGSCSSTHRTPLVLAERAAHPSRSSVWEIHPVYNIEVCKGSSCDEK